MLFVGTQEISARRADIGSDTNIPKFGLNIFREILEKSTKYLQKFFKYLKISRKIPNL